MSDILQKLQQLHKSDEYPFHMPGHKRQPFIESLKGAYEIDITEIEGYDNLYEPEGMLKDALTYASRVYGSDETLFLVNGSTVGILSAITGAVEDGGRVLVARNCHKAVFHALELRRCETVYLHPVWNREWDVSMGIDVLEVMDKLKRYPDIRAVILTSPTYEGHVSDIEAIAREVHRNNIPLIVDEAHGAHFTYDKRFPPSAILLGADVVIQSMHKTLPCFTQTALLHMKKGFVDTDRIRDYLGYYQTSSPSYLFMADMDRCIRQLSTEQLSPWNTMFKERTRLLAAVRRLKHIRIKEDTEPGRLLISVKNTNASGRDLQRMLLERYGLQMEMAGETFVLAIITAWDTGEGYERLKSALISIDRELSHRDSRCFSRELPKECICDSLYEAGKQAKIRMKIRDAEGTVAGDFINLYPPGTPIVVPGEQITKEIVDCILECQRIGLHVQGISNDKRIWVYTKNQN